MSRGFRYRKRKNKLSAKDNKMLVSLKQRPCRTASKMSLKLRDGWKKKKKGKAVKSETYCQVAARQDLLIEVWSLSSRIHKIPHPRREYKRVGVSAKISLESCYTYPVFSSRLSNEKIYMKSQLTNLGIDQSGGRHLAQLLGAPGIGPSHFTVTELKVLLVIDSWRGNSKSLLDKTIPSQAYQRSDCSNEVRSCVFSFKYFLFLKIW